MQIVPLSYFFLQPLWHGYYCSHFTEEVVERLRLAQILGSAIMSSFIHSLAHSKHPAWAKH